MDAGSVVDAINVCVSGSFPDCTATTEPVGWRRDDVFAWRVKARCHDGMVAFEATSTGRDSGEALTSLARVFGVRCR
mgnify:CR=1 FL=1